MRDNGGISNQSENSTVETIGVESFRGEKKKSNS